jgi:hypothetical protein
MLTTLLGRTTESPAVKAARLRLELAQTELILAQSGQEEGTIFNSATRRSTGESGLFDDDETGLAAEDDSSNLLGLGVNRGAQTNLPRARVRRWLPSAMKSTRSLGNEENSKYEGCDSSGKGFEMSRIEVDEVN